jgi:serine-type D-Ala-D-Ala carboxypeptidase (penicillin-binding protein 5/6)
MAIRVSIMGLKQQTRMWRQIICATVIASSCSLAPQTFAQDQNTQEAQPVLVAPTSVAKRILLIDDATNTVLLERGSNEAFEPASFAKLMTAEIVFDAIETGKVALGTTFKVSEHAWRTGGAPSQTPAMFAALNSEISVDDLLSGMLVQGGNDAAIILAEGIAGDEAAFTKLMNERASALGLSETTFANPTGFNVAGNRTTLVDMVRLSHHIRTKRQKFLGYFTKTEFEWNKVKQRNRNVLLNGDLGVDGFITAAGELAGFGIIATGQINGRRVNLAMSGLPDSPTRATEARALMRWGYNGFRKSKLLEAGASVGNAEIFGGLSPDVAMVPEAALDVLLPVEDTGAITARVRYSGPLIAPISKGDEVGVLEIWNGDVKMLSAPLLAATDVEQATLASRARAAVSELAFGWLR